MDYLQYYINRSRNGSSYEVLNLIINGLPSILKSLISSNTNYISVLNLIINGLPSIPSNTNYISGIGHQSF